MNACAGRFYSGIRIYAFAMVVLAFSSNSQANDFAAVEQVSEQLGFQVSVLSKLDPIEINQIHDWELTLKNADGEPVEKAEISISGGMPAHNHGLPTAPRVTSELRPGVYLVEGMKFQMGGDWVVNFKISVAEETDLVTFSLSL